MRRAEAAEEPFEQISLHGLGFAALDPEGLLEHLARELAAGRGGWIITANVDYLRRYVREPEIRAAWDRAELVVADGMPLLWAARLQGTPLPGRVAGSDLVWSLAERAAREGWTLFLLGGAAGAGEAAARELRRRWPALHIAGVESPWLSAPPTEAELAPLRATLAELRPDLVLVALGSPKTEQLITALRESTPRSWWVGVGISLSFVSGHVRRAPRWVQRLGVEWLHRLLQEPRRLARRYLVDDLPFALRLLIRSGVRRLRRPRAERASAAAPRSRAPSTWRS